MDGDPWADFDGGPAAPVAPQTPTEVAPVEVAAPSLKDAPVATARDPATGRLLADPWEEFSAEYNDHAPSAQGTGDEALGFISHADHAIQRLNAINPLRMGLNAVFPGQFPANWDHSGPVKTLMAQAAAQGKTPGMLGSIVGDVWGSAPAMGLPGGPLVQGAVTGVATGDGKTPGQLASDAAGGAVAGKLGEFVGNGTVNAVAPRLSDNVQMLVDRKVPLTAGMLNNNQGVWGRLEQLGQNVPVAGELIRKRGNEALVGFNNAVANEAVSPLGATVAPGSTGHATYQAAKQVINDAYDGVGKGVPAVPVDGQYGSDMAGIANRVAQLPQDYQRQFANVLRDQVGLRADPTIGGFTPDSLSDAKAALNDEIGQWGPEPKGWDAKYVSALKDTKRALTDMLGRTSPEAQAQLAAADSAYPGFKTYQRAVRNSTNNSLNPDGYFNPQQFEAAVNYKASDATRADGAKAALQKLAVAGKSVLPTQFKKVVSPMQTAIETGVGAGVIGSDVLGGHNVGMALAALPMAMGPLYSKPVQDVLRSGLLATARGRSAMEGLLGPAENYIRPFGANVGGILGAQGAQAALPYYAPAQ